MKLLLFQLHYKEERLIGICSRGIWVAAQSEIVLHGLCSQFPQLRTEHFLNLNLTLISQDETVLLVWVQVSFLKEQMASCKKHFLQEVRKCFCLSKTTDSEAQFYLIEAKSKVKSLYHCIMCHLCWLYSQQTHRAQAQTCGRKWEHSKKNYSVMFVPRGENRCPTTLSSQQSFTSKRVAWL